MPLPGVQKTEQQPAATALSASNAPNPTGSNSNGSTVEGLQATGGGLPDSTDRLHGARKLRICVLHPSYTQSDSELKELDPTCTPHVYDVAGKYEWAAAHVHKATAVMQVRDLATQGFDVFLNLCDGAFDEDRAGKEVVDALERYNCAYTGANANFYEPSKELMKKMAYYYDVPTPPFAFIYNTRDLARQVRHMRYPLIAKHYNGYSSIGMGKDSRCEDLTALELQVDKFITRFGGALVEEFIEGREFTVLVSENPTDPEAPTAHLPVECVFGAGETFKHFDLKWRDYESIQWVPCPADEPQLCEALKAAAASAFIALGGVSYGRCDFRVDAKGNVFFLEINPNCGLFYPPDAHGSADYILTIDPSTSHAAFIDHLVNCALSWHASRQKRYEERFDPDSGYGLYALEGSGSKRGGFWKGELLIRYEGQPHNLITKSHVEKNWAPGSRLSRWFTSYAYPVTDSLFVTWSDDPNRWLPLNHSCDPNAWTEGLDLVARRDIAPGEQLTIDYATCCVENLAAFDCKCGASCCRGRVTGSDYLAPWVGERYSHHLSDYIVRKRQESATNGAAATTMSTSGDGRDGLHS